MVYYKMPYRFTIYNDYAIMYLREGFKYRPIFGRPIVKYGISLDRSRLTSGG